MAQFDIPTFADPFYVQTTVLDGVQYTLRFAYSQRERVYYLMIGDAEGAPLASGIKIVCNAPLLGKSRTNPNLPPGEIIAVALGPDSNPPGLGELGQGARATLVYFDASEARRIPVVGG